jgi:hypothetical protein
MVNRKKTEVHQKATILVDIDGVLNAFHAPNILPSHQYVARAGKYTVVLDRRHPEWMRELEQFADMRWATMWMAAAGPLFGKVADIGQDWPFLDFDKHNGALPWHAFKAARTGEGVGNYKRALIEAVAEDGQPLVWIDDDMTDAQIDWATKRSRAGFPTLFIRPSAREGLTRAQFELVLSFAQHFALAEVAA